MNQKISNEIRKNNDYYKNEALEYANRHNIEDPDIRYSYFYVADPDNKDKKIGIILGWSISNLN